MLGLKLIHVSKRGHRGRWVKVFLLGWLMCSMMKFLMTGSKLGLKDGWQVCCKLTRTAHACLQFACIVWCIVPLSCYLFYANSLVGQIVWLSQGWRHVSVNWVIIGSGNGPPPIWLQTITWNSDELSPIGPSGTKILIALQRFSFKKMHLKIFFFSAKCQPFCLSLNMLRDHNDLVCSYIVLL